MTEEAKLTEKIILAEEVKTAEIIILAEKIKQARKSKLANETRQNKARRYFIGPFQFLAISLIASESLLAYWMYKLSDSTNFSERIVVGSLSIAVLIAVLVVFCVVYSIKKRHGDCEH